MRPVLFCLTLVGCVRPAPAPTLVEAQTGPPAARVVEVVDDVYGLRIDDPYRWMEETEHEAEFEAWLRAQGAYARTQLDALPTHAALLSRLESLLGGSEQTDRLQVRGEHQFFTRLGPETETAQLWVRDGAADPRLVFDPSAMEEPAVLLGYAASPDGSLVACNLSTDGSEITTIHVVQTATGTVRDRAIPDIWGEFTASWLADGQGFFYTQLNADALADPDRDIFVDMTVRLHRLDGSDRTVWGPGVPGPEGVAASPFPWVEVPAGSEWMVATGMSARAELALAVARVDELDQSPIPWRPVAVPDDGVIDIAVDGDALYLLVTSTAPTGEVLRVDAESPDLTSAKTVIPAGPRIIEQLAMAADGLYLFDHYGGDSGLARWVSGKTERLAVPDGRALALVGSDPREAGVWLWSSGYDQPRTYLHVDGAGTWTDSGIGHAAVADFGDMVIEKTEAVSADGTLVPMTVLYRRGLARDGARPTLLRAYASYGLTMTPYYLPSLLAWLERDGVYAVCHARGGGAKGPAWHVAGKGANKPAAVQDFIACAAHLKAEGYTDAAHTGAWAASMGGVLVGGAITTAPNRFGAAFLEVPMLNPLRYLEAQNGVNQTAELGATPDSEAGLRILAAMDPTHQLRSDAHYPATLVALGLADERVEAWMSAKFSARMQASATDEPVWLRIGEVEGHGPGGSSTQRAHLLADGWSFLLTQLTEND